MSTSFKANCSFPALIPDGTANNALVSYNDNENVKVLAQDDGHHNVLYSVRGLTVSEIDLVSEDDAQKEWVVESGSNNSYFDYAVTARNVSNFKVTGDVLLPQGSYRVFWRVKFGDEVNTTLPTFTAKVQDDGASEFSWTCPADVASSKGKIQEWTVGQIAVSSSSALVTVGIRGSDSSEQNDKNWTLFAVGFEYNPVGDVVPGTLENDDAPAGAPAQERDECCTML